MNQGSSLLRALGLSAPILSDDRHRLKHVVARSVTRVVRQVFNAMKRFRPIRTQPWLSSMRRSLELLQLHLSFCSPMSPQPLSTRTPGAM